MTLSWSRRSWKLELISPLVIGGAITVFGNFAFAQVTPDNTLGSERSIVTRDVIINGLSSDRINGGAKRGANLFHSFQEFNVGEGRGVYFINSIGVENILSRVTGNNRSSIFGKLGVLGGNANLFLINPNGIIFGPHASLDVKGSFVATTANAIQFNNQGFFNASAPNVPPLLTVNPSALLFNQLATRSITNYSGEPAGQLLENKSGTPTPLFGLKVANGHSLLLVGGNVSLDSGGLNALGGRVELGGLAGAGTVGLKVDGNNLHLSFPQGVQRADVSLTNRARVDASGESSGNILVQGRRVTLAGGSQIVTATLGAGPGGTLVVTTSDSVELSGVPEYGANLATQTLGNGKAGDIKIDTQRLSVKNGAQVSTRTEANGLGGQLIVTAPMSVELIGTAVNDHIINSGLFSLTTAAGNAGSITINTKRLVIQDRAAISAQSTSIEDTSGKTTIGTGRGGNVTVIAPESVELKNGVLNTDTFGSGDAGDITIRAGRLFIQYGGNISTATYGQGKGGDLIINAPESVELIRIGKNFKGNNLPNLSAEAQDGSTGSAGNLTITTGNLIVRDGAQVAVSSEGTGAAGNLEVSARSIRLENLGQLTATSASGERGGDITLQAQDLLVMRRNSQISTTAGTANAGGNGGNIDINTRFLVALPSENSDITANAFEGSGGHIHITDQGIFGIEYRKEPTPLSDITASSKFGTNGSVKINTLDFVPNQGRNELPSTPRVPELIQGCQARGGKPTSRFVNTGRGGLPPNPYEPLDSSEVWRDVQLPRELAENSTGVSRTSTSPTMNPDRLVEATGWIVDENGNVELVAKMPTATSQEHCGWR